MKLAISGEVLGYTDDLDSICQILKANDIRYLELWPLNCVTTEGRQADLRLFRDRDLARTKEILDRHGIQVCCVSFGGAFDPALAADAELYAEELTRAVEAADFFGAALVNHYCHLISHSDTVDGTLLDWYYLKALKRAEELGITLVLENEAHDMVRTPERMKEAVTHFHSSHFKTNYDATNYFQASCEAFPAAYDILKEDIRYVHIKNGCIYRGTPGQVEEWVGGELSGVFAPGRIYYTLAEDGTVNISGILARLKRDGYEGFCTLEPHTTRQQALAYYEPELRYLRGLSVFEN